MFLGHDFRKKKTLGKREIFLFGIRAHARGRASIYTRSFAVQNVTYLLYFHFYKVGGEVEDGRERGNSGCFFIPFLFLFFSFELGRGEAKSKKLDHSGKIFLE